MNLSEIYKVLELISSLPERKKKEYVIQENINDPLFKKVIMYAYDFTKVYKLTSLPEDVVEFDTEEDNIFKKLDKMSKASGTTISDANELNSYVGRCAKSKEIINRILKKDLRVGASIKTFKKFLPELPIHGVQLAIPTSEFDKFIKDSKTLDNALVSKKLNGVRCWAIIPEEGKIKYLSRKGKEYPNFKVFDKELREISEKLHKTSEIKYPITLDGEVVSFTKGAKVESFSNLMSDARRITDVDSSTFQFNVFDLVIDNMILIDRLEIIKNGIDGYTKVLYVEHLKASDRFNSFDDVFKHVNKVIDEYGWEGLIVKSADSYYEYKRANSWCKLKRMETMDLPVIGYKEGRGKDKGMVGSFICPYKDNIVNVSLSRSTDDEKRYFMNNLPELIEVQYQEETQNKKTKKFSLQFPVFVRVRDDK